MPIRINEGVDPLSDASLRPGSNRSPTYAQSEAGRVLRLELMRYCRGEVNGRSFLVAGHRGSGKTTMVADAIDRVLRDSRGADGALLRPLPIHLHGPSLFEPDSLQTEAGEPAPAPAAAPEAAPAASPGPAPAAAPGRSGPGPAALPASPGPAPSPVPDPAPDTQAPAALARGALTQIILGLHRAVVKEFARAYRDRVVGHPTFAYRSPAERVEFAELAAQFEVELMADPTPARLREFWDLAEAVGCGILHFQPPPDAPAHLRRDDRGALELVAVSGICEAYQRISGQTTAQTRFSLADERQTESGAGLSLKGAELVSPLVSVLSGVVVAGGAATQTHSAGTALLAGLGTALASSLFFTASSTRKTSSRRQADTTFIPDLSLRTLDRVLPTLLLRLREAGLAPVLVIDELDKVDRLSQRLVAMIRFLKKLIAENIFTCFLTDRGYLEQLRLEERGAYSRSSSYFSHPLLVTFRPADFDGYLDKLLRVDPPPAPTAASATAGPTGSSGDSLDLELLKWVLRQRCELHALSLTREISLLRGETGIVQIAPGSVRTDASYLIAVTFQVAIELQLAQPDVVAWLRLHPERSQTLIDAMYYLSRVWVKGDRDFAFDPEGDEFVRYLVERMNLDEEAEQALLADISSGSADAVLLPDDRQLLNALVGDLVTFLTQATDEDTVRQRWFNLPPPALSPHVSPTLAVLQALLVGQKSLLVRTETADGPTFQWRYRPSGALFEPAEGRMVAARAPAAVMVPGALAPLPHAGAVEEVQPKVERIRAIEQTLRSILQAPGQPLAPGEVFDLLADQWRILPTTPAWPPVSAAISNLELIRRGSGRLSTLADDLRVVQSFLDMLNQSSAAVCHVLVLAGYCAGTVPATAGAGHESPSLVRRAVQLLAAGLHFARLGSDGVVYAVRALVNRADEFHERRAALLPQQLKLEPALADDVARAFTAGRLRFGDLDTATRSARAWAALEQRLRKARLAPTLPEADDVSLEELVAAVNLAGPGRVLGVDMAATTLAQWTTVILLAAGVTREPIRASQQIPPWFIGPALRHLGAAILESAQCERLIDFLEKAGSMQLPAESRAAILEDLTLAGPATAQASSVSQAGPGPRLALCVAAPEAPMRQWQSAPVTGLVFVTTPQQAELMTRHGLFEALALPAVIAVSRQGGTPLVARLHGPDGQPITNLPTIHVHARREPAMGPDSLVEPLTPDDILEYARPRAAGPAPLRE